MSKISEFLYIKSNGFPIKIMSNIQIYFLQIEMVFSCLIERNENLNLQIKTRFGLKKNYIINELIMEMISLRFCPNIGSFKCMSTRK